MNDKKTVQKISRVKSNTCETKYVESNGTQDTANQEMYTNKTESFDKYIHSNSKTAKSPREIVNKFLGEISWYSQEISWYSQDRIAVGGESKGFRKPSIKSLINM